MTVDLAVAHALASDLDIVEIMPDVRNLPIEQIEGRVNDFLDELQVELTMAIEERGQPYLKARDAAGLCTVLPPLGIPFPILLRVCQTIVHLWAEGGQPVRVFLIRMTVSLS